MTTPQTPQQIASRVLELDEKATKGPFVVLEHSWSDSSIATENGGEYIASSSIEGKAEEDTQEELEAEQSANLNCLAYYRTAAPELARAVIKAESDLAELREKHAKDHERYTENLRKAAVEKQELEEEYVKAMAEMREENERLKAATAKPEINTHVRLFDLVRYLRSELHREGLITDEEYGWLCAGPMAMSPKGGSPSRQRLEDYDELRAKLTALRTAAEAAMKALELANVTDDKFDDKNADFIEAALAALRAVLGQAASNASNSPTASRESQG